MIRKFSNLAGGLGFLLLFIAQACTTPAPQENEGQEDVDTTHASSVNKIVYALPSPLRVISALKKSGGHYIEGIVNPTDNAHKYNTNFARALNMGVYGSDLAYATMHNQTQTSINCLKASKVLGDQLGISAVFSSHNIIKRFEYNLSNKDSLLGLITELYRESNAFLRENDNYSDALLMLAGGWVESLYIGTQTYEKEKNPEISRHLAEQKLSLENLIKMLNEYKREKNYSELISGLEEIQKVYHDVTLSYREKSTTVDESSNVISLNSETAYAINDQQLANLAKKGQALRAKIIGYN